MELTKIIPVILTYNEETNIDRILSKLSWAERIVVVDSFSDDKTIEILKQYPQVEIFQRKFDCLQNQWNFGLEQIKTGWVLSLDADYIVSDELIGEMKIIPSDVEENGFWIPLRFCIDGIPLKCSVLSARMALFRKHKATYRQEGHRQRLKLDGKIGYLKSPIYHDDRKPFHAWLRAQKKYSDQEVEKLLKTGYNKLKFADKLRKLLVFLPLLMPIYILLFKGGMFEGRRGLGYAYLRTYYEIMLSFKLLKKYWRLS